MPNYRLTLCYDGTRYNGWQRQTSTKNTIQEKIETALTRILGEPVEVSGSGRTDSGAHARMQTASFRTQSKMSAREILDGLRAHLPEDIGAVSLEEAPPRFHARLSCSGKTYLYRVWTSDAPCVFERKYVYVRRGGLDILKMREGAALLLGEHDFAAFCTGKTKKSTVRRIDEVRLEQSENELRLWFSGNGFLYNMVRILAGTLLEIGAGAMRPDDIPAILASRRRENAGPTLPARGLCLWETRY